LNKLSKNTSRNSVHTRKAIIWNQNDLLTRAVNSLLDASKAWDVVEVSSDGSVKNLIRETQKIEPDVVILCQEKSDNDPAIPLKLIREHLNLRVISIGVANGPLQVISRYNVALRNASDFLSVVEGSFFSDEKQEGDGT